MRGRYVVWGCVSCTGHTLNYWLESFFLFMWSLLQVHSSCKFFIFEMGNQNQRSISRNQNICYTLRACCSICFFTTKASRNKFWWKRNLRPPFDSKFGTKACEKLRIKSVGGVLSFKELVDEMMESTNYG